MLTPDEIRERIRRIRDLEDDGFALSAVIGLLDDVLPDLAASVRPPQPEVRGSTGDFADIAELMIVELRAMRQRHRESVQSAGPRARNAAILLLRGRGFTLSEIADAFGISRERVRMLERKAMGDA